MKKTLFLPVLLLAAVLILTACGGENPAIQPLQTPEASILAAQTDTPVASPPPTTHTASSAPLLNTVSPAPSPTPNISPASLITPGPEPTYTGAKLYDRPVKGKINIGVAPTVVGPRSKYYVPDASAQKKLEALMKGISRDKVVKMEDMGIPLGVTVVKGGTEWFIAGDDSVFYYPVDRAASSPNDGHGPRMRISGCGELCSYVKKLVQKQCGITELKPGEITSLASAQLSFNVAGKKGVQVITDAAKLKHIEERLSDASPAFSTSCPYYESILTLKRKDGSELVIRLATDGCPVYFHDGMYYNYGTDSGSSSADILALFDKVPWDER